MIKIQAVNSVLKEIQGLDIYAKSSCRKAKTIEQPVFSGKTCAKKRIQKTEEVFQNNMRKKSIPD